MLDPEKESRTAIPCHDKYFSIKIKKKVSLYINVEFYFEFCILRDVKMTYSRRMSEVSCVHVCSFGVCFQQVFRVTLKYFYHDLIFR